MLLKGFQIPPTGKFVNGSILVKLLICGISDDAGLWNEFYIDLDTLARKVHLFVRFWDILGVWKLNSQLSLTAQNSIQPCNGAFIAFLTQFHPEYDQTGIGISPPEVGDLLKFSFSVLVQMVVRLV